MKEWTKRRVALILALAMIASQMSGCKDNGTAAQNAASVSNNNAAVTEETQAPTEETVSEDAEGWLEENLDNIRQSLLEGDYAEVVEILLGMQDQLTNDPDFNALLYIAYMGNGNEAEAEVLLNNPNLDTDAFTDAFLENMDALKDNKDMEAIQHQLMAHMLGLGESNPDAYAAVARIGANIHNDDPTDPTAYAARYIAALAAGDEEAAKAILAEAEANGISAEALQTTALEYIEEYNLTNVTVEEEEKAKVTSTTYNKEGSVTKTETEYETQQGYTLITKDSYGNIVSEVYMDHNRTIVKRIQYYYADGTDLTGDTTARVLEGYSEMSFRDGKLESAVDYNDKKEKVSYVAVNADGTAQSGYRIQNGSQVPFTDTELGIFSYTLDSKGNVISATTPKLQDGTINGKRVMGYDYTANPAGVPSTQKDYDANGKLTVSYTNEYSFDKDAAGVQTGFVAEKYNADGEVIQQIKNDKTSNTVESISESMALIIVYNEDGTRAQVDSYSVKQDENGTLTKDQLTSTIEYTDEKDYKYTTFEDGNVKAVVNYQNEQPVDGVSYDYDEDGTKEETAFKFNDEGHPVTTYSKEYSKNAATGKDQTITQYYAEDGQTVTKKESRLLDEEGNIIQALDDEYYPNSVNKKSSVYVIYEDGSATAMQNTAYSEDGFELKQSTTYYNYTDYYGNVYKEYTTSTVYAGDEEENVVEYAYTYVTDNAKNVIRYDSDGYTIKGGTDYRIVDGKEILDVEYVSVLDEYGWEIGRNSQHYDENGNVTKTGYYEYDEYYNFKYKDSDGNPIPSSATEFTYVDGKITKAENTILKDNEGTLEKVTVGYTTYTYENGNRTEGQVYFVNDADEAICTQKISYQYDEAGKPLSEATYDVGADGNALYTDEAGKPISNQKTEYVYNEDGTAEKTATNYSIDENGTAVKTAETKTDYDENGQMKTETLANYDQDGTTLTGSQKTSFIYNEDGELKGYSVEIYDAQGEQLGTTQKYDKNGYLLPEGVADESIQVMMLKRPSGEDEDTSDDDSVNDDNADDTTDDDTEGGNTEGGNTEGGNTEGGTTEGGNTEGGNTEGDTTEGGNTEGGSTEGGNTEGGSTEGGNTEGGNTEGGNTEGGNTEGGNTEGGNTEGGNSEVGNTDSGNTAGGSNEAPAQSPAVTETPVAPKEPETPAEPEGNEPAGE